VRIEVVVTVTLGGVAAALWSASVAQAAGTAGYTPDGAISDVEENPVVTTVLTASGQRL
jgi:hypothetical protein